ncbi:MAG: Uma2 family endonuclease [Cyanophyceae cyanobacterium]
MHSFVKGKPCRTYINDAKVQVTQSAPYYYPDVVVTCNSDDLKAKKILRNPLVIVEGLSPSTAKHDLECKFREYQN